ncbi:MAG: hypothetical protein FJ302_00805 [Planctomycetes bacterium]|nr:hypothetical protein [Planctomycetota bacterium]
MAVLQRWWAIAGLSLLIVTWTLWSPQTEFPQIPLFGWAGLLPPFVHWLAFGVLLGSLATATLKPDSQRSWLATAVSLGVLLALDQHRLQPWAWQLLLMATWWSCGHVRQVSNLLCIALTISIYFWSALSKLDADFATWHGQTLIESLFRSVGINALNWPASLKSWLAISLPVGELLVAIGLCRQRNKRVALIAATALHVGLIFALGPLGLGHRPGVLLWNVAFIGHDWLLFGRSAGGAFKHTGSACEGERFPRHSLGSVMQRSPSLTLWVSLFFVCIWPVTERWGFCDRWLGWSVYAARSERISVTLTDEGLRRLPEAARRCVTDGELPLDRWSLSALDVPIYPQLRFQFGVVEWLRQQCGEENLVEVIVQRSRGGSGHVERLTAEQVDEQRRAYRINTRPRRLPSL